MARHSGTYGWSRKQRKRNFINKLYSETDKVILNDVLAATKGVNIRKMNVDERFNLCLKLFVDLVTSNKVLLTDLDHHKYLMYLGKRLNVGNPPSRLKMYRDELYDRYRTGLIG